MPCSQDAPYTASDACTATHVNFQSLAQAMQESARNFRDPRLFLPAAIGIGIVVVLGFGPTYFYRPFITPKDSLTTLVHLHGALMSAWIALFITQVILVASGRTDLHRRLGRLGFLLLLLIILVALPMIVVAAKLGGDHMPGPALPGLALVLGLLTSFVTLAGLGLHYRFRSDVHKRLMILAALAATEAAVSRLPLDLLDSYVKVHAANDALVLLVVMVDSIRHRRLHPAFLWGTAFLIFMQTFATWLAGTAAWERVARSILALFT
jgi:hypothetical protein